MTEPLVDAVTPMIRDRFGAGAEVTIHRIRKRRWSWHVEIGVQQGEANRLLLKIPRWEEADTLAVAIAAGSQSATVEEHTALVALADLVEQSDDPGLAAVRPMGYLPEVNGILMPWAGGVSLRSFLSPRRSGAESVMRRVGRLVALLHRQEPIREVGFDPAGEGVEAQSALDSVPKAGRLQELGGRLLGSMDAHAGVLEPFGQLHGDLSLDNVIVDDAGRVALVDPNPRSGPLLYDQSLLLGDLRHDRAQLVTLGLWRRRSEAAAEAFSEALGLGSQPLQPLREAIETMHRWVRVEAGARGVRRIGLVPARRILGRALGRRLTELGG